MKPLSSVRGRTTLAAMVLFGLALALAGISFVSILRRTMFDNVDTALELRAADLGSLVQAGVAPRSIGISDEGNSFAQILLDGNVVASSDNLDVSGPVTDASPGTIVTIDGADATGDALRFLVTRQESPAGPVTIIVGTTLEDLERTLRVATTALLLGLPVLTMLAGVTTWIVVGRALRPVDSMRAEVAEISVSDLDRRVSQPTTDDEIGRLADTMNAMLDRLDSGTRLQRQFVSDASHELRTPIAIIRHRLEVALASPPADWPAVAHDVLDEDLRMQHLVDDLLRLARLEGHGQTLPAPRRALVDLDDIVLDQVERRVAVGTIDTHRVSAGQVRGDEEHLGRVIGNLLDNALRHASEQVDVAVETSEGLVTVHVDDDGAGVRNDHRRLIFDRFARADPGRARSDGGAGLGLSIVSELVTHHGGTVEVTDSPTLGGARFTVAFPDARSR